MSRKDDHIRFALTQQQDATGSSDFDDITFMHHALGGIDEETVTLSTSFAGKPWTSPLFINGMTGGSPLTGEINAGLAVAAAETGIAIASGSMSAWLREPGLAGTYRVLRAENPSGFVMANLNANATPDQVCRAVELLAADAVQIHLNAVQEIVMPEGDRAFSGWSRQIERIVRVSPVPVIVKEVGFGLSRDTVVWLRDAGVAVADLGGRGGTNFARIENARRATADYGFIEGWGQSTPQCLLDASGLDGIGIAASGGIRSPLDAARALALGACATGIAGRALAILVEDGVAELISVLRTWQQQLRQIMTVLGAASPGHLAGSDLLVTGGLAEFARLRGIDLSGYAARSTVQKV